MPSPPFDRVIAQVQEALRVSQPAVAVAQLTTLLQRKLPVAQQAHAHGLLAQAYELNSQWDAAAKLLHPYEARTRTAELPVTIQQILCLRLASLHTEQGKLPAAMHFARQALQLAELVADRSAQGEAH